MLNGVRFLAIVPARSGSKGIPDKNLQEINGETLIARAARLLADPLCSFIDSSIISTDSEAYAEEATRHGLSAPFLRPSEISGDESRGIDYLKHAIEAMEHLTGTVFDVALIVEPTCPFRLPADIKNCAEASLFEDRDLVVTVSPLDTKFHPDKIFRLNKSSGIEFYSTAGNQIVNRQELAPLYYRNGACYAVKRWLCLDGCGLYGGRTHGEIINRPLANIDDYEDLRWARFVAGGEV